MLPRRETRGIEQLHHRDPLFRRHRWCGPVADGVDDALVELQVVARLAALEVHVVASADLAPARLGLLSPAVRARRSAGQQCFLLWIDAVLHVRTLAAE